MKAITYRKIKNKSRVYYRVIVPLDLCGGKRKRLFFREESSAKAKVKQLEAARGGIAAGFHRLDLQSQAKVLICLERVGGDVGKLTAAIDAYIASGGTSPHKDIKELIDELVEEKQDSGMRPRYIHSISCSLKNFRLGIGTSNISEVTPDMIRKWLHGENDFAAATKRGYLTDVRTLFSFAVKRGYCARNIAETVEKPVLEIKPPGIHTVEQTATLLQRAQKDDPGLIGYIAPIYFGGLRPNESALLKSAHIHDSLMEVTPDQSKTRRRRFIPINDTLRSWLAVAGVEIGPKNLKRRLARLINSIETHTGEEFLWPHDVLRHSFCSYGLPKYGAAKIAEWAGHSEQVLFAHYRERVKPIDVERYWAIRPE